MTNIYFHNQKSIFLNPDLSNFEVVERKFRGHPDSLADMVAQRFTQLYIQESWRLFPNLRNTYFPNFSADKITISGATTKWIISKYDVLKPIHALLIGKITQKIGDVSIDIHSIFKSAINDVFEKSLGHSDFLPYVYCHVYSATLAGSDHNPSFYNPKSIDDFLNVIKDETHANDTVYVVAYAPLSIAEKLSIYLDNITVSSEFQNRFPQIGSDIKTMIRRRDHKYDVTMCLPVLPERVTNLKQYDLILNDATTYIYSKISLFLRENYNNSLIISLDFATNTKDTKNKKYYAVWGTALSKGDIGAVGRGNHYEGFISGMRPYANEAFSGKNPNHFAGMVYQWVAEDIAINIYKNLGLGNIVYISSNNGDKLNEPNSIDIVLEKKK